MLSPTYEITTALSHTDELISPPYDIAIVTISYGRVTKSPVWDTMMSKKNMGWPFYAAVPTSMSTTFMMMFGQSVYIGYIATPDSKVHGANMGRIWGRQDPFGPHFGPMNFAIWDMILTFAKYASLPFNQSGRSPKVVALFLLQTLVAIWYDFFQLHDTIKMKSNHTEINYNHNNIAIRNHIMIYNSV